LFIHTFHDYRAEHNLRQAISEILEQTYAIEYSMGLFYRKGSERELARAQDDIETMRAAVDRLATIIASANQHEDPRANIVEAAE
jgi:hypothetical protein